MPAKLKLFDRLSSRHLSLELVAWGLHPLRTNRSLIIPGAIQEHCIVTEMILAGESNMAA